MPPYKWICLSKVETSTHPHFSHIVLDCSQYNQHQQSSESDICYGSLGVPWNWGNRLKNKEFTMLKLILSTKHFKNEMGTGAGCVPQLFLWWLLGTHRSAIGHFFLSPKQQFQKSLRKLTRPSYLLVSKAANNRCSKRREPHTLSLPRLPLGLHATSGPFVWHEWRFANDKIRMFYRLSQSLFPVSAGCVAHLRSLKASLAPSALTQSTCSKSSCRVVYRIYKWIAKKPEKLEILFTSFQARSVYQINYNLVEQQK